MEEAPDDYSSHLSGLFAAFLHLCSPPERQPPLCSEVRTTVFISVSRSAWPCPPAALHSKNAALTMSPESPRSERDAGGLSCSRCLAARIYPRGAIRAERTSQSDLPEREINSLVPTKLHFCRVTDQKIPIQGSHARPSFDRRAQEARCWLNKSGGWCLFCRRPFETSSWVIFTAATADRWSTKCSARFERSRGTTFCLCSLNSERSSELKCELLLQMLRLEQL